MLTKGLFCIILRVVKNEKRQLVYASLAQLVEQLTLNQWVRSSSLRGSTNNNHSVMSDFFIPRRLWCVVTHRQLSLPELRTASSVVGDPARHFRIRYSRSPREHQQ